MADARVYQRTDGTRPFDDRFNALRDDRAAARITVTVAKLERGLRPDVRAVGEGVQEAKIDYGPGYRVYFGLDGASLVVLLLCGDKRMQDADIQLAHALWAEYRQRKALPPPGPGVLLKPQGDDDAAHS
jgi:putative addiction module killer protein